jgi:TolA-binding protein
MTMPKLLIATMLNTVLTLSLSTAAQTKKPKAATKAKTAKAAAKPAAKKAATKPVVKKLPAKPIVSAASKARRQFQEALNMYRSQQYVQVVPILYNLSRRGDLSDERTQIKYMLGSSLLELKMFNTAAFQFVDVIRKGPGKYTKASIEKLAIAADALGDETFLNYAISRVQLEDFPEQFKDIIYFRLGEIKMKNKQFDVAADLFTKVASSSRYAFQARFNRGLAFLEAKQPENAIKVYQVLLTGMGKLEVTDTRRVSTLMALARSQYQAQQWDESAETYRQVPRDHVMWHDSLFEQSWAHLRAARYRSALSNFQSLHSTYYDDFYLPESLLLRGIVYLYICKYDEMDKVLELFEKTYGPVRNKTGRFLTAYNEPLAYYREIELAQEIRAGTKDNRAILKLPFNVSRFVMEQGDVKRSLNYIHAIEEERKAIRANNMSNTAIGKYAVKILDRRLKNAKIGAGEQARVHLVNIRAELRDLYEQAEFAKYEMINGKKEQLRKRIAGKSVDQQIDEDVDREFYIQNGYEYWPFQGEFWIDEIGNYHYLGKQSCE